jgi:GT2 family glycosyltransferase
MKVSIVIATYNRASDLYLTLKSLKGIDTGSVDDWEVLVVGNNCTDETSSVVASCEPEFGGRLRYIEEPLQGLSHARNRGVEESRFDIIAFLDDDVDVDLLWLRGLVTAYETEECGGVGGRAFLIYPDIRPAWLNDESEGLLTKVEHGPSRREAAFDELYGVNMSMHRKWVNRVGPFRTDLGRVGASLVGDEDVEMLQRIAAAGGRLIYEPSAVVGHRVPHSRLQRRWFWSRCYWGGVSSARTVAQEDLTVRTLRRPTWHLIRTTWFLVRDSCRHGLTSAEAFYQSTRWIGHLGHWLGVLKRLFTTPVATSRKPAAKSSEAAQTSGTPPVIWSPRTAAEQT